MSPARIWILGKDGKYRDKNRNIRCPHGRTRPYCKECGGSQICEHGRTRPYCKECGGSSICEHGKTRAFCKECGGNQICEHGKQRSKCKECHGGSVCEHNKQRYNCKQYEGTGICEHNRRKSSCSRCRPRGSFTMCLNNARNRELSFELSFEDYEKIVSGSCTYCGESFEPMTCDRKDSSKGYYFDNCQPLCNMCNVMKMDWSEDKFEKQIIKIVLHRGLRI